MKGTSTKKSKSKQFAVVIIPYTVHIYASKYIFEYQKISTLIQLTRMIQLKNLKLLWNKKVK